MRRHQPAVKRGREQFATVYCEQFRVRHLFSGPLRNRGSLATPPHPRLRSRRHASVSVVAARRDRASGQPSCNLPGPPAAMRTAPRLRLIPAPEGGGGQGIECLSDQRLQLILFQARAEFPFHAFSHLLPGPSGGFHLLEHVERLCQGAVLGICPVPVPSSKDLCHFLT